MKLNGREPLARLQRNTLFYMMGFCVFIIISSYLLLLVKWRLCKTGIWSTKSTAVAHFLGHKYRILGHLLLRSIYETKMTLEKIWLDFEAS